MAYTAWLVVIQQWLSHAREAENLTVGQPSWLDVSADQFLETCWSSVYTRTPRKRVLIKAVECRNNRTDGLASENDSKQAKSKVPFPCVL